MKVAQINNMKCLHKIFKFMERFFHGPRNTQEKSAVELTCTQGKISKKIKQIGTNIIYLLNVAVFLLDN